MKILRRRTIFLWVFSDAQCTGMLAEVLLRFPVKITAHQQACDTCYLTHWGRWTFSYHFRSLGDTVWEERVLKILRKRMSELLRLHCCKNHTSDILFVQCFVFIWFFFGLSLVKLLFWNIFICKQSGKFGTLVYKT